MFSSNLGICLSLGNRGVCECTHMSECFSVCVSVGGEE